MTDQRLDAEEAGRSQGDITQVKENRIDSYGWTGGGTGVTGSFLLSLSYVASNHI